MERPQKELLEYLDSEDCNFEESVCGDYTYYDYRGGGRTYLDVLKLEKGKIYVFSLYYSFETDVFLAKLRRDGGACLISAVHQLRELELLLLNFERNAFPKIGVADALKILQIGNSKPEIIKIEINRG